MYICSARKPAPIINIIQCDIEQMHCDLLHEKSPIVITSAIHNLNDIVDIVFKYHYISKHQKNIVPLQNLTKNMYAYSIFKALHDGSIVKIKHPNFSDTISVKLYKHNVLILPFNWYYNVNLNMHVMHLHSLTSIL